MSAATVLTSAMAGMPVLNGTEGSLAALIRYIAPILGWSIEFDNGPVIVIRPQSYKGGQALCYRIDDRAARGGLAPRTAEIKAYESMSDINTGAGLVGTIYIQKSYTANTTANAYEICGDAYGFYIHSCKVYASALPTKAEVIAYIGFSDPILSDAPICVMLGQSDSTSLGTGYLSACAVLRDASIASTPNCFIHKNMAATLGVAASLIINGGPHPVNKSFSHYYNTMPAYDGNLVYGKPYCNDGSAFSFNSYLPGLYYLCHSYASINALNLHPFNVNNALSVDGKTFVTADAASQTATGSYEWGFVAIDIGEGFRP